MSSRKWKIVPISENQKKDVREEDLLEGGVYRRCSTYRGGGGYDQFPLIAARTYGGHPDDYAQQFVAQIFGCHLDCPYCYVTRSGVWGEFVARTDTEMVEAFLASGASVFHLMGGAPALQMKNWPSLIETLRGRSDAMFHSDILLTEARYDEAVLSRIAADTRSLYAVDVKGLTPEEWLANTRKPWNETLFWENWRKLEQARVPAYLTFTAVDEGDLAAFWERCDENGIDAAFWRDRYFVIDLIDYDATPFVDSVAWGGGGRSDHQA